MFFYIVVFLDHNDRFLQICWTIKLIVINRLHDRLAANILRKSIFRMSVHMN